MSDERDAWVRTYFGADYRASVENILTAERTAAEVSWIVDTTRLAPPARIADFGCGHGRHVNEFAIQGFDTTGIDLNSESLAIARHSAPQNGLAHFIEGDYGSPPPGPFDMVTCLFGSFGFSSEHNNEQTLAAWCKVLSPGGWLVLELWNREHIVSQFEPRRVWRASDDVEVDETRTLDLDTGRLHVHYIYTRRDGRRTENDIHVRLYDVREIRELLAQNGLELGQVTGSLRGVPYSANLRSVVLLARKAGPQGHLAHLSASA